MHVLSTSEERGSGQRRRVRERRKQYKRIHMNEHTRGLHFLRMCDSCAALPTCRPLQASLSCAVELIPAAQQPLQQLHTQTGKMTREERSLQGSGTSQSSARTQFIFFAFSSLRRLSTACMGQCYHREKRPQRRAVRRARVLEVTMQGCHVVGIAHTGTTAPVIICTFAISARPHRTRWRAGAARCETP